MVTVCPKCGKTFMNADARDKHLLICSDIPLTPVYKCPYCDYVASSFDVIRNHVIRNHTKECPVCGKKTYSRHNAIRAHATWKALLGDKQHMVLAVLLASRNKEVRKHVQEVKNLLLTKIGVESVYNTSYRVITVRLDSDLVAKVDEYARQRGISRSQAINEAVKLLVSEKYARIH